MNLIIILIFLVVFSSCVELFLPLSGADSEYFDIKCRYMSKRPEISPRDYVYTVCYMESVPGDLIRRVIYNGLELFRDNNPREPSFRRMVLYALLEDRVVLGIVCLDKELKYFDSIFHIKANRIIDMMENPETFERILMGEEQSETGRILTTIFNRCYEDKGRDYGELDTVDDEPQLAEGKIDLSPEEIEDEVRKILENNQINKNNQSQPGPSGISRP